MMRVWRNEAIGYWRKAGQLASRRSANREAVKFFEQALDILQGLPESHASFDVYQAVCTCLKENGIELTSQVRDTIGAAIFKQARKGIRDPDRLWSRAMREVESFNGVRRTLDRLVKQASSASPSRSQI